MENSTNTNAPVSPVELVSRQLSDWQTLHKKLEAANAPADQLDYCESQIDYLMGELYRLQNPTA